MINVKYSREKKSANLQISLCEERLQTCLRKSERAKYIILIVKVHQITSIIYG